MKEWSGHYIQEYLDELIRLEGRGDANKLSRCPSCKPTQIDADEPIYRCDDCAGSLMECQTCCVSRHERLPLHIVKVRYKSLPAMLVLSTHIL